MTACFSIRRLVPRTWHTEEGSRLMSSILRERLRSRCRGRRWKLITLTYDREGYEHPRDVYDAAKAERHTARFIERLGKRLGRSLAGKWICKMEFQRGGWLHWHILLEEGDKIDWRIILEAWGRGRIDIRHASKKRIDYLAKYVAKPGEGMPGWLLGEPSRSVRVIRASSGFWSSGEHVGKEKRVRMSLPAYESIGQAASRHRGGRSLVNCGGWFMSLKVSAGKACNVLLNAGFAMRPCMKSGALLVQGPLERAVSMLRAAAAKAAEPPAAVRSFSLSRTPKPPASEWLLRLWSSLGLLEWRTESRLAGGLEGWT